MSDFADNHITNQGSTLLARTMAGEGALIFTRIVMGDGNMPETQSPSTMTDVVSPKATASITKCAVTEAGDQAVVGARFTNEDQDAAFEWRELGLYAKVGEDAGDVLYSYGYTPQGELIPAGVSSGTLIEKLVDIVTYVGDAAQVTAVFDPDFIANIERITEAEIDELWGSSTGGGGGEGGAVTPPSGGDIEPIEPADIDGIFDGS